MLPSKIPNARVFTYDWPADTFRDAVVDTLSGFATTLLDHIHGKGLGHRPMIFIASCFGGLLLAKAFVLTSVVNNVHHNLLRCTVGITFLGTPFRGANGVNAAQLRVLVSSIMGDKSCDKLLEYVELDNDYLQELVDEFSNFAHEKIKIWCFYETRQSNIARGRLPKWAASFLTWANYVLVPRQCACLDWSQKRALYVPHVLLNKFCEPEDPNFVSVSASLAQFAHDAENIQRTKLDEATKKGLKLDLDKLPYAKGAMFDSYDQDHTTCHPSTRVDLLRQIQDWARQPHSKSIFWLNGMAGTGKSTISWTIAEWLTGQGRHGVIDLGASFFFKRGEGDRGSASRFFSTLTRDLLLKIPGLDSLITKVIDSDPSIFNKSLGEQFDKLIYQPLQKVYITSGCPILVLVVDALDECEKRRDIEVILDLWSQLTQITTIRLKLFLTSRPDLPILQNFKKMSIDSHHDMILHDEVPRTTIQHDISAFLKDAFVKIREDYNADPPSGAPLDDDWPSDKVLQSLVDMAVPLFIVAATVYRYVGDPNWNPQERLETILQFQGTGQLEQMEQTYLPVLTQLPATLSNSSDSERLYQEFRMVVGSIVILAEPLSVTSLAALLNMRRDTVVLRLRPLQSVLRVSADRETPVRTLHLSFGEFLLSDKLRNQPFGVDGVAAHRKLLTKCLELLSRPNVLRENLCDLKYPGQPRREVSLTMSNERISHAIQYACQYWVHHVQHSMIRIHDDDEVHVFLREHFLHWFEALSLINRISEVIRHVSVLQSLVSANNSTQLSSFLEDARRVVLANRYIADFAPLQIYSSAMIFAPQTSIVRNICGRVPVWLQRHPITPVTWSSELQKLEGHTGSVNAVVFSQDGSLLASASDDETVRLWNPTTGQEVQKLEGHINWVNAVAFSQDGSLLASASGDWTVRLWNPTTGKEVQNLEGHTGSVSAVAFSQDGSLLASASDDWTVRLWNPTTGKEAQKLEGHTDSVSAVTFSQDGSLLASASEDWTVRLWNPTTGQAVQKFENLFDITNISLTSDNRILFTNRGALYIDTGSVHAPALESSTNKTIMIKNDWIQQNNRNFLWLPHEYRSRCSAFYGNTFAIGRQSGQVSFFQFDYT